MAGFRVPGPGRSSRHEYPLIPAYLRTVVHGLASFKCEALVVALPFTLRERLQQKMHSLTLTEGILRRVSLACVPDLSTCVLRAWLHLPSCFHHSQRRHLQSCPLHPQLSAPETSCWCRTDSNSGDSHLWAWKQQRHCLEERRTSGRGGHAQHATEFPNSAL